MSQRGSILSLPLPQPRGNQSRDCIIAPCRFRRRWWTHSRLTANSLLFSCGPGGHDFGLLRAALVSLTLLRSSWLSRSREDGLFVRRALAVSVA